MVGEVLPRALLVDGYNIISSWEELKALKKENLGAARDQLLDILQAYIPHPWAYIIVVFDAHQVMGGKTVTLPHGRVQAVYTGEGQTADAFIERLTADFSGAVAVEVATSDLEEQRSVFMHGASRISARELALRLKDEREIMQEAYSRVNKERRRRLDDHLSPEVLERLENMRRQKKPQEEQ
jgi:predicted RNA-binding protein with PIN domain